MATQYLSKAGLTKLWGIISTTFVAKEDGKGLSTEDFTTDLKDKLEAIEEATTEDINQIVAKFA